MAITSWSNYVDRHTNEDGEFILGSTLSKKSMTVPGQTLPLKELLARYRRGANVEIFEPQYTLDPDLDGIETLSTIERAEYALEIKDSITSFRQNTTKQKQQVENQPVAEHKTDTEPVA